ncbi:hypothetical protein GCM10009549_47730 [Streptomyces thermoalcalitolerans]|uniref:Uncharacterized protein n=1 Tax=Streptomyces thermoalcalitolerans TaxID=65605 RepID=A0ABN1PDK7_9ACTN
MVKRTFRSAKKASTAFGAGETGVCGRPFVKSSGRWATVSSASPLVRPVRATGPRRIQPVTYRDRTCSPFSAVSGQVRGTSGCPSYQETPGARRTGDEVGGAVGTVEADAGDGQRAVGRRTGGEEHCVVERAQVVQAGVLRMGDIAEEPDLRCAEHLVERGGDALDPGVSG